MLTLMIINELKSRIDGLSTMRGGTVIALIFGSIAGNEDRDGRYKGRVMEHSKPSYRISGTESKKATIRHHSILVTMMIKTST